MVLSLSAGEGPMNILAIDGGASSTKWHLAASDGRQIASDTAGPLHGHLFDEASRAAGSDTLRGVCSAAGECGQVDVAVAGITGLARCSEVASWLGRTMANALALPMGRVLVADDLRLTYLGLVEPGSKLLLYAGTGAIGYHIDGEHNAVRVGGHGYLIDDAGGGFYVGRQALRHWLRALDAGAEPVGSLAGELAARLGSKEWEVIRQKVYSGGRGFVAGLTPAVLAAAESGDPTAIGILESAGSELGRMANRLLQATGRTSTESVLIGGMVNCAAFLIPSLNNELDGGSTCEPMMIDTARVMCDAVRKYGIDSLQ